MASKKNDEPLVVESEQDSIDDTRSSSSTGLVLPDQNLPGKLLLLPIFERPFFPAQVQPLVIDEEPWEETFSRLAKMDHHLLGLCYAGDQDDQANASPSDFADTGCVVRLHNVVRGNGKIQFIAQGMQRFRIDGWLSRTAPFAAEVSYPSERTRNTPEIKAYAMALIQAIKELIPLNPLVQRRAEEFSQSLQPERPLSSGRLCSGDHDGTRS